MLRTDAEDPNQSHSALANVVQVTDSDILWFPNALILNEDRQDHARALEGCITTSGWFRLSSWTEIVTKLQIDDADIV